jgi:hypothetical protein
MFDLQSFSSILVTILFLFAAVALLYFVLEEVAWDISENPQLTWMTFKLAIKVLIVCFLFSISALAGFGAIALFVLLFARKYASSAALRGMLGWVIVLPLLVFISLLDATTAKSRKNNESHPETADRHSSLIGR